MLNFDLFMKLSKTMCDVWYKIDLLHRR